MNLNIITGYPTWYLLLCILAGILGAMILYFREHKSEFPAWLKRMLGLTRFLVISLLAFLLLSPLLKLSSHTTEKPIVIFAQDNSMSMVLNKDSAYYRDVYLPQINQLLNTLDATYDVQLCTYGEGVSLLSANRFDSLAFDERESDISALFDMMDVRFVNRNIGAVIIAGDGIYNKGYNPVYRAAGETYPIYTIALGDTSMQRDALFKRVLHNTIAFEGNDHPVEVIINAAMMDGSVLDFSITEQGEQIYNTPVAVNGNSFSKTLEINLPAGKEGLHHYVLILDSRHEELTYENNSFDLFVEVLKSKQKILILSNSPHPDISVIKQAIQSNVNYEVDDMLLEDFSGQLKAYSLVILHQLPSFSPLSQGLIQRLTQSEVPVLYILGKQSDLRVFRNLKTGMRISIASQGNVNEVQPLLNESFSTFGISSELKDLFAFFPPLNVPFSRYSASNSARVLFTQKIGEVESPEPLWIFEGGTATKSGVIAGTGLWKWRLKTWLITGEHELFDALINKTVQYLAMKDDKRRFRVSARQSFPENEVVSLQAELYNESFEAINKPDVNIEFKDEEGNAYNYIFSRTGDAYLLKAGGLDVGSYTFNATAAVGDQVLTDRGGFVVTPVIKEQTRLIAEYGMLNELAESNNASMIYNDQISSLSQILNERNDLKPVLHAERKYIDFIDLWWVLIIITGLLGTEWFLRKWGGSY